MTEYALARSADERLLVNDPDGALVGWVELATGRRVVTSPERAQAFADVVDSWFDLVGDTTGEQLDDRAPEVVAAPPLKVTEIRYPDAPLVRSLVAPLIRI
ncbi:MAG: hypothetical protein WAN48_15995 [Actinomycetes bacterium]